MVYVHQKQLVSKLSTAGSAPSTGTRSVTPQAMYILKRAWKHKMLPPLLKTFCWRLIRRDIATRERAGKHSNKNH
jgi:hypothetical protein